MRRPRRRHRAEGQPHPRPGASLAETHLYALVEVASAAGSAHRLEDVLELVADRALEALGCASLSISRFEADRAVTLINVGRRLRRPEKESSLTAPIVIEGTTWGELWAASEPGRPRLTERDGLFLRAIADQVAAAIGRAELFVKVEALAYTDPLTGLANRRVLEHELERNCDEPAAAGSPALLLCDIDGLKAVNDRAGHEVGDAVIIQVAKALTEAAAAHEDAVVSRIGGDEFCVLLPSGGADDGREIAEDAARRLSGGGAVPVRISSGVAARSEGVERPAELLRAADFAQYRAKHAGPDVPATVAEPGLSGDPDDPGVSRAYRNRSDAASRELAKELLALVDDGDARPEERLDRLRRRLAHEAPGH